MLERCYSTIAIKGIDEDQRLIRGVASTPEPDRIGDVVEPLGLKFRNPVPLLWQHRHDTPVGTTRFERPTRAGIGFEATLPKVDEAGIFKDTVDHAWGAIKHGACRAVSIGFMSLDAEPLGSGGTRFKKAELLELSLVSVPANPGATITEVRALDQAIRRGDPAISGTGSSLWSEVVAAGAMGMDRTKDTDLYQRGSDAHRTAMLAGGMSRAMIEMLCARIEAIERHQSEPTLRYVGVWKADRAYRKGDFATHSGCLWHCNGPTDLRPGEGGGWQLAVKAGRDGKDAPR